MSSTKTTTPSPSSNGPKPLTKFTNIMMSKGAFVRDYAHGQEAMAHAAETLWLQLCYYDARHLSSFNDAYPGLLEFVNDWASTQYGNRLLEVNDE